MGVIDRRLGATAGRQDNVVTITQIRECGLSHDALKWRLHNGLIQRLHTGVYLIGPAPPSFHARARAAALAVAPHSAVSMRSAAARLGFAPEPAGPIHVTVSGRDVRSRSGIIVHRSRLTSAEVWMVDGVPVTSPARTLADLAATEPVAEVEQLLIDARVARVVRDAELWAELGRTSRMPGRARLRELLRDESEEGYSRSRAERRMRSLIRDADLPRPEFNARVRGFMVDCLWARLRVVGEVDSESFHGHRDAFHEDRRRDQVLAAAGFIVIRITWRQLTSEPLAVAVRLGQALARAEAALPAA